ncbi:hypothetical protein SH1V18_12110 [Vallitalea longa]|uniref:Flagellar hook-length control protein FliK n=1 Tax=Vallitalea longa TaxID=2936439 RepID=A0A9W5Y9S4_9FIRM|nr:DUF6240 domain-containing protein [Vallitalea longa]GKX28731.1 hypothetical protein SH1V18_12110 [Vallitalea longa]
MNKVWDVSTISCNFTDNGKRTAFTKGNNVYGLIKEKNDKGTLVEVMNRDILIPSNVKIMENVGETCSFTIEETKGDKIKLKYINREQSTRGSQRYTSFKNIWNKNISMSKEMMDIVTSIQNKDKETKQEYNRIIDDTKKQLDKLISKVTDEDIQELINKNYNPEKMTLDIFEKSISNNKVAFKNDDTKKIEEEVNKKLEYYTKIFGNKEEIKSIIKKLKEKNMPVNEHNIMKLRSTLNKYDAIKHLKEEAILNVLKNNIDLTVKKLYEAKYSSVQASVSKSPFSSNNQEQHILTDDEMKQLEPQIKELFKNNDIADNKDNMNVAKTLIKNDIEVDKDNIDKYLYLKDIESKIKPDEIISKGVDNIINDKTIDDIELMASRPNQSNENGKESNISSDINTDHDKSKDYMEAKNIVDNIPKVKDEHLRKLIHDGKTINLDNLVDESKIKPHEEEVKLQSADDQSKYITARRQLEEIRLKMTVESANRLINNGIKIDTQPLNDIVEGLKKLEQQNIKNELKSVGVETTESNITKMNKVMETVSEAKRRPNNILGQVMKKAIDYTLGAIANNDNSDINKNNQLIEMYDKLGTKPRTDLGDSLSKTFDQLGDMLEDLDIDINPNNVRAAKILAYNEMDISESNINNIKLLDQQVSIVLNRLHPNVVAHMIKDNLSPIEMNIDEVINYMNDFDEYMGEDLTDKIAPCINEMDKSNSLTEKERNSMIGIYRMLNTISKSEGRAVGFLMKKDMKLSLNNLMEAAKYLRKTGGKHTDINVNVDDDFGTLQQLQYDRESIRKQIEQAFEKAGFEVNKSNIGLIDSIEEFELKVSEDNIIDMKYMENNIKEFIRKASPNNLKELLEKDGIMDKDIDEILSFIDEEREIEALDTREIRHQLNLIKNISSKSIEFLQNLQLPINLKNLNTINSLLQDNNELSNKLKHFMNEINDSDIDNEMTDKFSNLLERLADGEEIESLYTEFQNELEEIKGNAFYLNSNKRIDITRDLTDITRILDMNKELEDKEGYMQIPVILNGEITQLNMYYIDKDKINDTDSTQVLLSLKTKNLGIVNSVIKISDKDVELNISSNKNSETEYLMNYHNELKDTLEDMGYNVTAIRYENTIVETPLDSKQNVFKSNTVETEKGNFEILI